MSTEAYKKLLKRYLEGDCTEEEEKLIEEWYNSLNLSAIKIEDLDADEIDARLWDRINSKIGIKTINKTKKYIYRISIAASFLIALFFYYKSTSLVPFSYVLDNDKTETVNDTDDIQLLKLVDGTLVKLYPKSSITYSKTFLGNKREVYLKGKAFFDVAKNKQQPFFVHNYHNTIHVVGTSFLVQSLADIKQNYIEVMTGKVWVEETKSLLSSTKENQSYVLTPNQKLIFDTKAQKFSETIVTSPKPMAKDMEAITQTPSFTFTDSPLENVIEKLEETYGLTIELENKNLTECTFTGNLNDEDLFKKLDLLCTSIGAKYTIKRTNIYINGKGCR